jgi:uncharacterized MAPEG superfamily protein
MPRGLARLTSLSLGGFGLLGALAAWWWLAAAWPPVEGTSSMAVRLGWAAAALCPAAAVLLAMIAASFTARFITAAFDPLAGRDGKFLAVNQRVISNSVEQFAVFAPALLAWAAGGGAAAMGGVLAAGLLFAAARLLFWAGYHAHPFARAPGMAATLALGGLALVMAGRAWWG